MDTDKGQKIIAALYLATSHLSDNDPLKAELRTQALFLTNPSFHTKSAQTIEMLLGAAVLAKVVSEKNASIINFELRRFISPVGNHTEDSVTELFIQPVLSVPRASRPVSQSMATSEHRPQGTTHKISLPKENIEAKSVRHDAILSFINTRKSAAIKDISALFPELSEKTIQRELGALVSSGKITKRGSKRWSIYMAVGA